MTLYLTPKKSILTSLVLLSCSHIGLVQAEYGGYYTPPTYNQAPPTQYGYDSSPYSQSYGYDQGSNYMPYDSYNQGYNAPPNNQGSGFSTPWNNSGSGFNAPWSNNGSGFSTPWNNNGSGFNSPWNNNRSGFSGPWNNNRGSGFSAPWDNGNWGNGGRNPFGPRSPDQWMSPNKNNFSNNWDDMLNAPSRMGRMPGGWNAPSVSVPNPIDVGDEFGDAARDMPDQMNNFQYNR